MNSIFYIKNLFKTFIILCVANVCNAESNGTERFAGNVYTWHPFNIFFYDAPRFKDLDIKSRIEKIIIKELSDKGYEYSDTTDKANFYISYQIILSKKLDSDEIESLLEQHPELKDYDLDYDSFEDGSFKISAISIEESLHIWENSMNAAVYLKSTGNIEEKRISEGVNNILLTFPRYN